MEKGDLLTISQLTDELQSSPALTKFAVNRFSKWLSCKESAGKKLFSQNNIVTLIFLLDKLNQGVLPSAIEKELEDGAINTSVHKAEYTENKDTVLENRKITALEKRNEIEFLKIDALNNIAEVLSSMAGEDVDLNETCQPLKQTEIKQTDAGQKNERQDIDDLSKLIDDKNHKPDIKEDEPAATKNIIDNLADLIEGDHKSIVEKTDAVTHRDTIDDLSALIEPDNNKTQEDKAGASPPEDVTDDLSLLIDPESSQTLDKTDNLSILIDQEDNGALSEPEMDDLSLLFDNKDHKDKNSGTSIDDLSALIDIDPKEEFTITKPKHSPKENFEAYKSEVINIIIELKDHGYSENETCERFNAEGILTFSGKAKWSLKTISQVYKLIDNAA